MINAFKLMMKAAEARRLAETFSDVESAKRLRAHADELEQQAMDNVAYKNAPDR
jgi:hypothetical protein